MKGDTAGDGAMSEYEAKRRQRMEENRRMLETLNVPTIPRRSPRPQPPKAAAKLEPTRRSSRQQKRRAIAEQHAQERQFEEQLEIELQTAKKKARQAEIALKRQRIELVKEQQKLLREQKKEEERRKKQKITKRREEEERRLLKIQQRKEVYEVRYREWQQRQQELEKKNQLSPEVVAQRNADIQKLIQDELNKQATLAKERKQLQAQGETGRLSQVEQNRQLSTTQIEDGNKAAVTGVQVADGTMLANTTEIEYESVL